MKVPVFLATSLLAGCASLLPTSRQDVNNPWNDFDQAKKSFDEIVPYATDMDTVRKLGFDPYKTPNRPMQNAEKPRQPVPSLFDFS